MTIQAEYQRMRLQQDMRQVRTRHTEQLSAATLRADLAQTTLESTQLLLYLVHHLERHFAQQKRVHLPRRYRQVP